MGSFGRRDLFQFLIRGDVIAQTKPALGGVEMHQVVTVEIHIRAIELQRNSTVKLTSWGISVTYFK